MRFLRRGRKPEGWAVHTAFRSRSRSREWRSRASGAGIRTGLPGRTVFRTGDGLATVGRGRRGMRGRRARCESAEEGARKIVVRCQPPGQDCPINCRGKEGAAIGRTPLFVRIVRERFRICDSRRVEKARCPPPLSLRKRRIGRSVAFSLRTGWAGACGSGRRGMQCREAYGGSGPARSVRGGPTPDEKDMGRSLCGALAGSFTPESRAALVPGIFPSG